MIPQTLIQDAARDGLILAPTETGTLRVHGPKAAITKWAPILKEHKAELLAALQSPTNDAQPGPIAAPPLSHADEQKIRQWLRASGETGSTIENDLEVCRRRLDTRQWLLGIIEQERVTESVKEAFEERAAIMEHDGGLSREEAERIAQHSRAFYDHLMGPGIALRCCHAPHDRYCPEGQKLRDTYYTAAKAASRLI
ncbi:MAG: hypothetical protein ACYDAZ_09295 [Thermoplasmataceae archaeon]